MKSSSAPADSLRPLAARTWGRMAIPLIFAAVAIAYAPIYRAGFIWDDDGHVTRPDLRSLGGLYRIWFERNATQQYYPVLHSAFWLEHRLWGDAPLGYHVLNLVLHATAACLFAWVLVRLGAIGPEPEGKSPRAANVGPGGGRSSAAAMPWLAAALFALHPVAVESVAWISEQKNTLSTVFYLCSALIYLRFDRDRRWGTYAAALGLFVLAVLTKSVTVTLPAALLVALWWRRGRLRWRQDVRVLLPWIAVGVAAGLSTAWIERKFIGAEGAPFDLSFAARLLVAGRAAWFYLGKLVWPHPLIFIYPRWRVDPAAWAQWCFPVGVFAGLGILIWRRRRGQLAAALCFLGTLFPALGFFNIYPFVFSYVADHFQYLASLGIYALAAAGLERGWRRAPPNWRPALGAALGLGWVGCGFLTAEQTRQYHDMERLNRTTLAENPDCWLAHDNLGVVLARSGRIPEAIAHYQTAFQLNPQYAETEDNLGTAWAELKRWDEAAAAYAAALRLRPQFPEAEVNWGNVLSEVGAYPAAITHYEAALRLRPRDPEAEYRLANARANAGQLSAAVAGYEAALRLQPAFAEAEANLGLALTTAHRLAEAIPHLERAVSLNPGYAEAQAYFGFALAQAGQLAAAVDHLRTAVRLRPDFGDAHYQLAEALQALGRDGEAADEFTAARRGPAPK